MFATLDTPGNRVVSVHVLEPDIRREVEVPEALHDAMERTLAFPTTRRMINLARDVAENPRFANYPVEAVELTVWRVRPTPDPIRTVRVEVDH